MKNSVKRKNRPGTITGLIALSFAIWFVAALSQAEELYVFPSQGQSQEQVETDKAACYLWAKEQSGFDPTASRDLAMPSSGSTKSSAGRSAVRGALLGAAVGSLSGDMGKGAAIGGASGGLIGGIRKNKERAQQQNSNEQFLREQENAYNEKRGEYNRAYTACMEGKGYTVK